MSYNCTVSQVLTQKFPLKFGEPPTDTMSAFLSNGQSTFLGSLMASEGQKVANGGAALYQGKTFNINKSTGAISSLDGLSSDGSINNTILNPGSTENSFILLIEGAKGIKGIQHFIYVQVEQYSADKAKPFKAIGLSIGNDILLGNCLEG